MPLTQKERDHWEKLLQAGIDSVANLGNNLFALLAGVDIRFGRGGWISPLHSYREEALVTTFWATVAAKGLADKVQLQLPGPIVDKNVAFYTDALAEVEGTQCVVEMKCWPDGNSAPTLESGNRKALTHGPGTPWLITLTLPPAASANASESRAAVSADVMDCASRIVSMLSRDPVFGVADDPVVAVRDCSAWEDKNHRSLTAVAIGVPLRLMP